MENPFEIINERLQGIEKMLTELTNKSYPVYEKETTSDEIFKIEQVAKYLFLSVPTIYGYISKGLIPHYKVGKRLYFKKTEILDWIYKNKRLTNEEIQQQVESYLVKKRRK